MEAKLNPLFESVVQEKRIPGIAAGIWDRSGTTLFKNAYGLTDTTNPQSAPMTTSTQLRMHSCTKAVTTVAALQLLEQGRLSLSDPVEKYVPEITKIQILERMDVETGKPVTRATKVKPTIHHLMTHTAGFTYDFFDPNTLAWRASQGQEPIKYESPGDWKTWSTPLAHEPGTEHTYGINIDWLGFVIQAITGLEVNEYIEKFITGPLGLKNTGPTILQPGQHQLTHGRTPEGYMIVPNFPWVEGPRPVKYGGGHFLNSTIDDFGVFLVTLLNDGTHPVSRVKILDKDTVDRYIFSDHLPLIEGLKSIENVGVVPNVIPFVSNAGTMLPGVKKGWSCGMMLNLEGVEGRRCKGSASWSGLGNLYFWIDREKGVTGLVGTSLLPFWDQTVLELADELEAVVYREEGKGQGVKNYKMGY